MKRNRTKIKRQLLTSARPTSICVILGKSGRSLMWPYRMPLFPTSLFPMSLFLWFTFKPAHLSLILSWKGLTSFHLKPPNAMPTPFFFVLFAQVTPNHLCGVSFNVPSSEKAFLTFPSKFNHVYTNPCISFLEFVIVTNITHLSLVSSTRCKTHGGQNLCPFYW